MATFGEALYDAEQRGELPDGRGARLARVVAIRPPSPSSVKVRPCSTSAPAAGIDVILSAKRVGPTGIAYGLDMTDEMLALAQQQRTRGGHRERTLPQGRDRADPASGGLGRRRDLELRHQPLRSTSPPCSSEIRRVLRPGGRIGISDIVAEDHLTPADRAERGSYVGCIAGALSIGEYEAGLEAAGFEEISVEFTHEVADGMHGAIVKAMKTREPASKGLPVIQPAANAGCC